MSADLKEKYGCQKEFYELYPDVYINWKYYYTSTIHIILYFAIFSWSYYESTSYYGEISNLYYYTRLFLYSWISGWSLFGLISIGHDACHKSLFPHQTRLGNFLNQIFSWLFLDCLAVSSCMYLYIYTYVSIMVNCVIHS